MESMPPLQVTLDVKTWSCVLDLRLALARNGAALALRLAEELRVCLVPRLWYVLDHSEQHRRRLPRFMSDPLDEVPVQQPHPDSFAQWERARLTQGLSGLRLYWAGDALHESFLPRDVDSQVVSRFERLARGLEQRMCGSGSEAELPLVGGGLDAAALAGALSRHRPLLLTLAGRAGATPPLCRQLEAARLPCRQLAAEESEPVRRPMTAVLARSGALELCWAGLELALVHLVVPRALFVSEASPDEDRAAFDASPSQPPEDIWEEASAYWYRLP